MTIRARHACADYRRLASRVEVMDEFTGEPEERRHSYVVIRVTQPGQACAAPSRQSHQNGRTDRSSRRSQKR